MTSLITKVKKIAQADLLACYRDGGILASNVNFDDFWARDSFFASLGILESGGETEKVKQVLELFIKYQRTDGKIPRKIVLDFNSLKYLGIKIRRKKPRPIYASSLRWHFSVDDNLLFVIAFCRYIVLSGDNAFGKKYFAQAKNALEFYAKRKLIKSKLLYEAGFANWEDTIYKKGHVFYSNVLWYAAVREFEVLRNNVRSSDSSVETRQCLVSTSEDILPTAKEIFYALQETFWLPQEKYFADSVKNGQSEKYFDLAGHVLAIIFDIATKEQIQQILNFVETYCNVSLQADRKDILHPLNNPRYPIWKVNPVLFLFGIQNYQNQNSWSWIETLLIIAQLKGGHIDEAQKTFETLGNIIVRDNHIHETYFLDGRPFNHLLWKSAVPFAWGAGLMLWAVKNLEE